MSDTTTTEMGFRRVAGFLFPDPHSEDYEHACRAWKPEVRWLALHWKVLLVAHTLSIGHWQCHCVPVPGKNHSAEAELWQTEGAPVQESIARAAFPEFSKLPYGRTIGPTRYVFA